MLPRLPTGMLSTCFGCSSKQLYWKGSLLQRFYYCSQSHYDVLRVERTASARQIKAAFVAQSKEMHPDKDLNDPDLHAKFVRLNEAYSVLGKPSERRRYDLSIAEHMRRENLRREMSQTYTTAGSGPAPGHHSPDTAFYHQPRDDTINPSRQATDPHAHYYGIKGVHKKPHWVIVMGCVGVIVIGLALHSLAFQHSKQVRKDLDEISAENQQHYIATKRKALLLGNERQLENLKSKLTSQPD